MNFRYNVLPIAVALILTILLWIYWTNAVL